ncbi:uncharacterized protein LOC110759241 [Prunus avium]|uniref:Uncharacterized protein LOC110759241 n=1 Tax=Prunus avium TaxID=42229 RepID=A0A6P5SRW5_PRUAV|nr:uncharacterized protein LOC110759241 [Prunus avium]
MDSEFSVQLQTQAYGVLSSKDAHPMETLFSHLFSPQEPQRSQAYSLLHCCRKHFPDLLFIKLFYVIRQGPSADIRARSALVLRFVLCDLWPKLSLNAQINMKNNFLVSLQEEGSLPTLRILCAIASEMASEISGVGNEWPEFIEYLLKSFQSDSERFQLSALWVLAFLPKVYRPVACKALAPSIEPIHLAFLSALNSENADIQVATFSAVVSLIHLFSNSSGRNWFHDLLRGMMVGLFNLLSRLKEDYARGALKELIMLVMEEPQLLKPYLNELVLDMLKIAESEQVTEGTKVFVHKFLLTIAEASDLALTMRGLPHQTLVRLLTVPMKLLLCINDDNECYNKESDQGANVGKTDLGIAYLTKISTALGEKTMTPIAFELFLEYMDACDWKKRHAGISMLAVIAKECSGEMVLMKNCLEQVTSIILKSFQDPHSRVCCAAFNFMQLPITLIEAMQILHHLRIVPALVTALDQHSIPRVKEQAASAILHLIKKLPSDGLRMHTDLDTILSKLQKEPQGHAAVNTT